jgi:outer membrane protein TolC
MVSNHSSRRKLRVSWVGKLVAPACLCLGPWLVAADEPAPPELSPATWAEAPTEVPPMQRVSPPEAQLVAPAPPKVQILDLAACRRLALEKQPAVAAAQASLAAAEARAAALDHLHAIPIVAADLPYRRNQAALGVAAAQAMLEQARCDTIYNVTRCYLAVVFARMQESEAAEPVQRIKDDIRDPLEKAGSQPLVVRQADIYIAVINGRVATAREGSARALAGLREALGLPPDACLDVATTTLPNLHDPVCLDDVIKLALARRGEVVQAQATAEAAQEEIKAQDAKHFAPTVPTFAAGGDIHATLVPPPNRGNEYNPGGVPPEMPTQLVGKRCDRVQTARELSARADSVVAKVQGLVVLEARDAYHRWQEASSKLPHLIDAADRSDKLYPDLLKAVRTATATIPQYQWKDVVRTAGETAQLKLERNDTHYQLLLSLAALERITCGGFCAGFEPPAHP